MDRQSERFKLFFDLLHEDSVWKVQKVCNMATLHREYQGIHSLPKISFSDIIIDPASEVAQKQEYFEIPEKLKDILQKNYNSSQFEAIKSSLKKSGITLIQGPPGTGKTNTILGILSVLLNSEDSNDKKKLKKSTSRMKEETIYPEKPTEEYNKLQFSKAMPWLKPTFVNPRDQDKSPIILPLEKHLVYPRSNKTDE